MDHLRFSPVSVSDLKSLECATVQDEIFYTCSLLFVCCSGGFSPVGQRLKGTSSFKLQSVSLVTSFRSIFIYCLFLCQLNLNQINITALISQPLIGSAT